MLPPAPLDALPAALDALLAALDAPPAPLDALPAPLDVVALALDELVVAAQMPLLQSPDVAQSPVEQSLPSPPQPEPARTASIRQPTVTVLVPGKGSRGLIVTLGPN